METTNTSLSPVEKKQWQEPLVTIYDDVSIEGGGGAFPESIGGSTS